MVEPVFDTAAKHRWLDRQYVSVDGKLVASGAWAATTEDPRCIALR